MRISRRSIFRLPDCELAEEGHATQLVSGLTESWVLHWRAMLRNLEEGRVRLDLSPPGCRLLSPCVNPGLPEMQGKHSIREHLCQGANGYKWRCRPRGGASAHQHLVGCNILFCVLTYWRSSDQHAPSNLLWSYAQMMAEHAWMRECEAEWGSPEARWACQHTD